MMFQVAPHGPHAQYIRGDMKCRRMYLYGLQPTLEILSEKHCGLVMPYGDIDQGQHWLK